MWRRLGQLPGDERADLLPAAWRLVVVWLLLGTVGPTRSRRWLGRSASKPAVSDDELACWRRRALGLKRIGARLPGARCLARSLCLWWWMRSAGLDAMLEMGVRRDESGAVTGHAWVSIGGRPVDETAATVARFQPLRWSDWPDQVVIDQ
ncbi:MAG: lasso peptide biosynthesis B2 protein [Pseudomonadota bacterium]|nr:MAG: lasso peptide biosynthesis B2 protein [Pseudomonadota bacterium]